MVNVQADVRPGADAKAVSARLDQLIAELIAKGPTADEVSRVATQQVASEIAQLESVNGFGSKAATLAEGELYSDDPEFYKKRLARFASVDARAGAGGDEEMAGPSGLCADRRTRRARRL